MKKAGTVQYAEILHALTKSASPEELPKILRVYVSMLARKKMLGQVAKIIERYRKIAKGEGGIVEALLVSAEKLPEKEKESVVRAFKKEINASEIELQEKIDPTQIAGWKIKTDGYMIDGTVRSKLTRLHIALNK